MKIAVLGLGFVGTTSLLGFSHFGMDVVGIEKNLKRLDGFKNGVIPFFDKELQEKFASISNINFLSNALEMDNKIKDILVCVETPLIGSNLDLSIVKSAIQEICQSKNDMNIWLRSTIDNPYEINKLEEFVIDSGNKLFLYPEFMREGSCWKDFLNPAFTILAGSKAEETAFYSELIKHYTVHQCNFAEAITIKISSNAFHALKVTFANELQHLSYKDQIDIKKVMEIFCTDTKLNISSKYLFPGEPYSGPCLKKDTLALSSALSQDIRETSIIRQIDRSNEKQIDLIIKKIENFDHISIGFLGLEFKEGSGDIRNSYIIKLIKRIQGKKIHIYDDSVTKEELEKVLSNNYIISNTVEDLIANTDVIFTKFSTKLETPKELISLDSL
jgi:GDP-mannose 6-dehydrogenase